MSETSIEWTDATWNPVRGCSRVSAGCERCYAERVAHRFSGPGQPYEGLTVVGRKGPRWSGDVRLVPEKLDEPLRWRKPRRVFVNSMSDLFHEGVPDTYIAAVFGVMAAAPQHTFQVLTKRPERARAFFERVEREAATTTPYDPPVPEAALCTQNSRRVCTHAGLRRGTDPPWPLPNVWLGVSVESQDQDHRISELLRCPAAVRWVSYEPALGPVSFADHLPWAGCDECGWTGGLGAAYAATQAPADRALGISTCPACGGFSVAEHPEGLDWIVVGGESGPGARPFDVAWARSTIRQGAEAGVPVFVKQLGARPIDSALRDVWCDGDHHYGERRPDDPIVAEAEARPGYTVTAHDVGRLLRSRKGGDMAEWPEDLRVREMPRVQS